MAPSLGDDQSVLFLAAIASFERGGVWGVAVFGVQNASCVCLPKQTGHCSVETEKVGRLAETIHDPDAVARLKEYAALLEEVERLGNALRQTLTRTADLAAEIRERCGPAWPTIDPAGAVASDDAAGGAKESIGSDS